MSERESEMYYNILKNVLSTAVGKKLVQYDFRDDDYGKDVLNKLFAVVGSKMNDDHAVETYTNHVVDTVPYSEPYALITAHCTYTVRRKDKNDDIDGDNTEEYNFIIAAFCPAHTVDSGFSYNNSTGDFSTESDSRLYISPKPTDGFIYPTFDNRSPNVSSVMYYSRKAKDFNSIIVEDTLGCNFQMSPICETQNFNYLISQTFGEELNYSTLYNINEALIDYEADFSSDTRAVTVSANELINILRNISVSEDDLNKFSALYKGLCGDCELHMANIISNKIKLQTSEYTVNVKLTNADKISTTIVDGSRAIKLSTGDSLMTVNDIPANIQ